MSLPQDLARYFLRYERNSDKVYSACKADLVFRLRSTIGDGGLNFRVRNENGWTPSAKAPTLKAALIFELNIVK